MNKLNLTKEVKPYLFTGLTLCAVILFYKLIGNISLLIDYLFRAVCFVFDGLKPLFWALVITYFLYRPVDYLDKKLLKMSFFKRHVKISRITAILIVYAIFIGVLYLVLSFVLPQIWASLTALIAKMPNYIKGIEKYVKQFSLDGQLENFLSQLQGDSLKPGTSNGMQDIFIQLLNKKNITFDNALSFLLQRVLSLSSLLFHTVISMFLALYLLLDKEVIGKQLSGVAKIFISKDTYHKVTKTGTLINEMFYKFFIGKIYCSIFISVIVFLGLVILKVQHGALISLIIGITNIIPYFGPIIGGAIGAVITLLFNPVKAVWVLFLVVIAQQVDDNILAPRILGDRIGLKPFWIMLAVILGGELFGVMGMFLSVPTFAVLRIFCIQWMQMWKGGQR